jgi:uncharacterized RDD family membrane protein YckC
MTTAGLRPERAPVEPEAAVCDDAGLVTRTIAFAVDAAVIDLVAFIVAGIVALIASVLHFSHVVRTVAVAAGAALFVLWCVAYFVTFWTTTGETPGSRVMQIHVARLDGGRLRPRHALVRLVGMVVSLPLLWGYIPILFTERRRGVPDMMAGTVVCRTVHIPRIG